MKEKLEKLVKYFIFSADNSNKGAAQKKVIGYILAVCFVAIHASWLKNAHEHNDYSLLMPVLIADYSLITAILGLNVADKKINSESKDAPPTV